eukprot:8052486-Pyramimonas_sp.AAC.1
MDGNGGQTVSACLVLDGEACWLGSRTASREGEPEDSVRGQLREEVQGRGDEVRRFCTGHACSRGDGGGACRSRVGSSRREIRSRSLARKDD